MQPYFDRIEVKGLRVRHFGAFEAPTLDDALRRCKSKAMICDRDVRLFNSVNEQPCRCVAVCKADGQIEIR